MLSPSLASSSLSPDRKLDFGLVNNDPAPFVKSLIPIARLPRVSEGRA
jgi:hypothetical protein